MTYCKQTTYRKSIVSIGAVSLMSLATPGLAVPLSDGFYDIGGLGGNNNQVNALSTDGTTVVGGASTFGFSNTHAYRWSNGTMTDLGTFGGDSSFAFAVSADGSVVVGQASLTGNTSSHAFRWVDGTMTDLGTLGGNYSFSNLVSVDGNVVAGRSRITGNAEQHAFRWVDGTMTDLGVLAGGGFSSPTAMSDDGSVIAGEGGVASGYFHAFRWTNGTMTDLGTFGGNYSSTGGISGDGSVVVGRADRADGSTHAYRWVNGTMTDLGTLGGGNLSNATAVSADGNFVAGGASTASGQNHAFRWTNGTMTDLGVLTGADTSFAQYISADGAVVVGSSSSSLSEKNKGGGSGVFRWAEGSGMQSIPDWLAASGVAMPSGYSLVEAKGVNADGSVVMGSGFSSGKNFSAWLAKADGGFIADTNAFNQSIISTGGSAAQGGGLAPANLALFGSHHRTLLDSDLAMGENGTCVWSTVDAARNSTTDSNTELAEIGLCRDFAGFRVGAGIGTTYSDQEWQLGGNAQYNGRYVLAEIDKAFATAGDGSLQVSLLGYYGFSTSQLNRAYANGGGIDISSGAPDVRTSSIRARLDWKNAAVVAGFTVSPYSAFTWSQSRVDGYTETGGGFPVTYGAAQTNTNDLRIGSAFARKITPQTNFRLGLEYVHQFQKNTGGINGQIIGLSTFSLPGQTLRQDWARMTLDVDYALKPNAILTAGLNTATSSNEPTIGITLGLRASF